MEVIAFSVWCLFLFLRAAFGVTGTLVGLIFVSGVLAVWLYRERIYWKYFALAMTGVVLVWWIVIILPTPSSQPSEQHLQRNCTSIVTGFRRLPGGMSAPIIVHQCERE